MPEHSQDLKISAARAFRESLDQLQSILAERQTAESEFPQDASHLSTSEIDLTWEEAVADIEQFFCETQLPENTSDEKS